VAYHFHWPYEQIMGFEHFERQEWVNEIAKINKRLNEAMKSESEASLW
jgi:hypothetical protein